MAKKTSSRTAKNFPGFNAWAIVDEDGDVTDLAVSRRKAQDRKLDGDKVKRIAVKFIK